MTYIDRTITPSTTSAATPAATMLADHSAEVTSDFGLDPDRSRQSVSARRSVGDTHLAPLLSVLFGLIDETRSIVVNVTAAHPGAGSSAVARKLAEAAAATGWCRVALLDAAPAAIGAEGRGLVDMIERGEPPTLISGRMGSMGVDTGRLSTAGRDLSRIESLRRLYGSLRDRYTLVVVDCPAVFAGQQTLTVAAAADETVLVVEAERTALEDVARAREALARRGAGVLGMVMNKSRMRTPGLFGRLA